MGEGGREWSEATVLGRKLKRGIFEEVVEEEEELTQDGGQREFGGFAGGAEALVEGAEDGGWRGRR